MLRANPLFVCALVVGPIALPRCALSQGYAPAEAAAAVAEAASASPGAATADLIRAALKALAPAER